jgi:hypothetical protein
MRVSIVVPDDIVVIDGVANIIDCKELRGHGIHAIQWYEDYGDIEFERHAKPNEIMHDLKMIETLVEMAKPIPSPKPPTPAELTEMHNRLLIEYPDWRRPWDERDAEMKRLFDRALQQPPILPPTPPKETETKHDTAKPKPRKK